MILKKLGKTTRTIKIEHTTLIPAEENLIHAIDSRKERENRYDKYNKHKIRWSIQ